MAETDAVRLVCNGCGNVGFDDGGDGYFYCARCGSQAEDIVETGVAEEDLFERTGLSGGGPLYSSRYSHRLPSAVKIEPFSQSQSYPMRPLDEDPHSYATPKPEPKPEPGDHIGPTGPADFPGCDPGISAREYFEWVRMTYVEGVQLMIQYQCEALVQKFNVSPVICDIVGLVWGRFVASTRVFGESWAHEAVSEFDRGEYEEKKEEAKFTKKSRQHTQQMAAVWCRSLRRKIPLSSSLAISYLACHVAREPILPTDILRWTCDGELPYMKAYLEIEKEFAKTERKIGLRKPEQDTPTAARPVSASFMFRPRELVPLQKLESMAACIAESIGLSLPPVNFYAIATRYLEQLVLPIDKILPYALHVCEWSIPSELCLSANEFRIPTRVCVMSILIVTIRILYNINGFGKWETSISASKGLSPMDDEGDFDGESATSSSSVHKFESDAGELLCDLQNIDDNVNERCAYKEDLPSYLQYCKDVIFAGLERENPWGLDPQSNTAEMKLIEQLGEIYQTDPKEQELDSDTDHKRPRENNESIANTSMESKKQRDDPLESKNYRDTITKLKVNMEENRFCYIPARKNVKRRDYLHYIRKRDDSSLTYVAHADYYILLRACAKVALVDARVMHMGVLSLERRLAWIEKRIEHCFELKLGSSSGKSDTNLRTDDVSVDCASLSNLIL